jgi:hypothetical protein
VPRGVNLVQNPGFEDGFTSWNNEPWAGGRMDLVSDAYEGTSAAQGNAITQRLGAELTCGVRYTVRLAGKGSSGGWHACGLDFLDAAGNEIFIATPNDTEVSVIVYAGSSYAVVSAARTAPAGTAAGSLWCWSDGVMTVDRFEVIAEPD